MHQNKQDDIWAWWYIPSDAKDPNSQYQWVAEKWEPDPLQKLGYYNLWLPLDPTP